MHWIVETHAPVPSINFVFLQTDSSQLIQAFKHFRVPTPGEWTQHHFFHNPSQVFHGFTNHIPLRNVVLKVGKGCRQAYNTPWSALGIRDNPGLWGRGGQLRALLAGWNPYVNIGLRFRFAIVVSLPGNRALGSRFRCLRLWPRIGCFRLGVV